MKRILLIVIFALTVCQIPLFSQWVLTTPPFSMQGDIKKLLPIGTTIFAASQSSFGANGVSYTTDNGTSWTDISAGFSNGGVQALAANGTILQVGVFGSGVFRTTNNGTTWTSLNNGLSNNMIKGLYFDDSLFLAGTIGGVYISTNDGDDWTISNDGLTEFTYPNAFARTGNVMLLGAGTGVFRSTNEGATWTSSSAGMGDNKQVGDFAVMGTDVFVCANNISNGSVFRSTDAGLTWTSAGAGLPIQYLISITASGSSLFAATISKVLQSTDLGASWNDISAGLPNLVIGALTSSVTDLFVGHSSGGAGLVWRRALSEVMSLKNLEPGTVPSDLTLSQNYPNPFNPSTTISFSLPESGNYSIKVFNTLGQEVAQLMNGQIEGGSYSLTFDASKLTSGLYVYTLQGKNVNISKKMILTK